MTSSLPASALALVEFNPIEDVILPILREDIPDVEVVSEIADDPTYPFILLRSDSRFGTWDGDPRFVDAAAVVVAAFCSGVNADQDAALLSEAVRVVLRDAGLNKRIVPGRGHITEVVMAFAPRRVTDWATATGPVQYADLPTGVWRYETKFDIGVRKSRNRPFPNL